MIEGSRVLLTPDLISQFENISEVVFALACLEKENLIVYCQIPINDRVIDFLVKNTRVNGRSNGMLVEVTRSKTANKHKRQQIEAMNQSGERYVVLYKKHLNKIIRSMDLDIRLIR